MDNTSFLVSLFLDVLPNLADMANVFVCINDLLPILEPGEKNCRRWPSKQRIKTHLSNNAISFISRNNVRVSDFTVNAAQYVPDNYFNGSDGAVHLVDTTRPVIVYYPFYKGSQKRTEESMFLRPMDLQKLIMTRSDYIRLCILRAMNRSEAIRTQMLLEDAVHRPVEPKTSDLLREAMEVTCVDDRQT